jgi:hypothetical protein
MPALAPMPPINVLQADLAKLGARWLELGGADAKMPSAFGNDLGKLFDAAVGESLRVMLGGIPVEVLFPERLVQVGMERTRRAASTRARPIVWTEMLPPELGPIR